MASTLRTRSSGGGGRSAKRARGEAAGGEEDADCPVCFNPLPRAVRSSGGGGRTEGSRAVAFPCGHVVCDTCDAEMVRRGFHACPTCRTPRDGYSQADVDSASQARVLGDQAAEEEAGLRAAGAPRSALVRGSDTSGWTVMFFRDQSQGHPFDPLLAAATIQFDAHWRRRHEGGSARARRAEARRLDAVERQQRQRRSPPSARAPTDDEEEEGGEGSATGGEPSTPRGPPGRPPGGQVPLDSELTDLIENYLLQPVPLATFLARHATATASSAERRRAAQAS